MVNLKRIWTELTSKYCTNTEVNAALFSEIEKAYSHNKRHYHNLSHLSYMLNLAHESREEIIDFDSLMFSIFYHDIVYNTKRHDNEQRSAEVARDRLHQLEVPAKKIELCYHQILATKDHKTDDSGDTVYLLDYDLAILGDTTENYLLYSKNIRKEYSIYPGFMYKKGRKKALLHFLNTERIFKTDEFYIAREQQARKNITLELSELG